MTSLQFDHVTAAVEQGEIFSGPDGSRSKDVRTNGVLMKLSKAAGVGRNRPRRGVSRQNTMKVSDVMTWRIISVSPDATILEAIKLMLKHHISGLPVIDHNRELVGIVTESDFLHRPETGTERKRSRWLDTFFGPAAAAKDYVRSHGFKVRDVMTHNPVTVAENAPLDEVVRTLESHSVKRLPVMRRGKLVGIVSRADLMLAVASIDRATPASRGNDAMIRNRIMAAIREQSWTAGATIDVIVRNGVADVWGTISDVAQRDALKVLVMSTLGVKRVEDHLTWQGEPLSAP